MRRVYALILIIGMAATAAAQQRLASVTPLPTKVEFSDTPATLDVERGLRLYIEGAAEESERLAEAADATGIALKRVNRPAKERYLNLRVTDSAEQGAEGYTLDVTERGVTITASTPAGIFYGLQSLRQMNDGEVECCTITDAPRFAYRGILIDISQVLFSWSVTIPSSVKQACHLPHQGEGSRPCVRQLANLQFKTFIKY